MQGFAGQGFKGMTGAVARGLMAVLAFACLSFPAKAQPASCAAMPVASSGAQGAEAARLKRQIRANEALSAKYNCGSGQSSLVCREIFGRIAQASRRLGAVSQAPAGSNLCRRIEPRTIAIRPFFAREERSEQERPVRVAAFPMHRRAPVETARIETMCVRLSDGYYFPSPNSGYSQTRDRDTIATQCRFICNDAGMDVYRLTGSDRSAEDMVSLTTGKRYAELPGAGAYRVAVPARTCDMTRYYKTALARMPSKQTGDLGVSTAGAPVPVPMLAMNMSLMSDVGLRGSRGVVTDRPRKVRVVGAAYLPAEE